MTDHLEAVLLRQLTLQRARGYDFARMTTAERVDYVRWNAQAAGAELYEALAETSWKPWAAGEAWLDRDRYLGELTDVLCFLLNMYLAVGATVAEVDERHAAKSVVNHRRLAEGYTGRDKCPGCGRAPDEPMTPTFPTVLSPILPVSEDVPPGVSRQLSYPLIGTTDHLGPVTWVRLEGEEDVSPEA